MSLLSANLFQLRSEVAEIIHEVKVPGDFFKVLIDTIISGQLKNFTSIDG